MQRGSLQGCNMIPSPDYHEQKLIYTSRDMPGLWRIISYCSAPTVTLENIITKERTSALGIYGLTAQSFEPITKDDSILLVRKQ
jgi:hypothetical protein